MTTQPSPPEYDPTSSGCWSRGTPVAWAAGHIDYRLAPSASTQVSLTQATRTAHDAFDTWNRAHCASGAPTVHFEEGGPIEAGPLPNVIVFDDASWPTDLDPSTLALTTVSFTVGSGEIFQARIEINSQDHVLWAGEPGGAADVPSGAYDLGVILTHEAGHFAGLGHATDRDAVMYALYRSGATTLTQDDLDGICSVYPPRAAGCTISGVGASSNHRRTRSRSARSVAGVASVGVLLLARTWRRTSKRDKSGSCK
jgi:hypothetical protein